jgi:hypothetical protein
MLDVKKHNFINIPSSKTSDLLNYPIKRLSNEDQYIKNLFYVQAYFNKLPSSWIAATY